jgi:hypothetical protein
VALTIEAHIAGVGGYIPSGVASTLVPSLIFTAFLLCRARRFSRLDRAAKHRLSPGLNSREAAQERQEHPEQYSAPNNRKGGPGHDDEDGPSLGQSGDQIFDTHNFGISSRKIQCATMLGNMPQPSRYYRVHSPRGKSR